MERDLVGYAGNPPEVEWPHATVQVLQRSLERMYAEHGSPAAAPRAEQRLQVLGPGCRRCDALFETTRRALRSVGKPDVSVERITDLDRIAAYGPLLTPALVVDGTIVWSGRTPSEPRLRQILEEQLR
ncbi:MAG: thioredoxin family protein [Armatimonadetes bacterium]|nr:thioredoxin family protein [Armatimonadota bacterium]